MVNTDQPAAGRYYNKTSRLDEMKICDILVYTGTNPNEPGVYPPRSIIFSNILNIRSIPSSTGWEKCGSAAWESSLIKAAHE